MPDEHPNSPWSSCRDCGSPIRWAKSDRGRFRPLTHIGSALVVDADNIARHINTYEPHSCDPDDIKAHEYQQQNRHDYERQRSLMQEASLGQECSACQAPVGQPCMNLTLRKKGEEKPTRWPHPARVPEPVRIRIMEGE